MSLPVAILAGGVATRLRPITETVPKSLVDVAGKPFIARQLEYLRHQGIESVVLCVGHLGTCIEDAIGDGSAFGISVRYSRDGSRLLGTGGALMKALPLLGPDFFVLYGDSYLPVDFPAVERAYQSSLKPALMTVLRNSNHWDRSNVVFRDGAVVEYDKVRHSAQMEHIDYGLSVLSSTVFARTQERPSLDLASIYQELAAQGRLAGYEVFDRFYEIGSHRGLEDTIQYFEQRTEDL